ncbi:GAF domain-containing protein [Candidatus Binatia bacterium]|nr:GAF domain-containing protein [Candidatus Binatia bacterium]
MRFRDGTSGQKALFALLAIAYCIGVGFALEDKAGRIGRPDVGFSLEGNNVSPTRWDAAAAGLWGGGQILTVNGIAATGVALKEAIPPTLARDVGSTNTLRLRQTGGRIAEVTLPVRLWTWEDALFAEGTTFGLGALFFVVGIVTFLLRPYVASSWALLAVCCFVGGELSVLLLHLPKEDVWQALYFRLMVGCSAVAPFHVALAFPVVHPVLVRRPRIVPLIYAGGIGLGLLQFLGWSSGWVGILKHFGGFLDTSVLLAAMLCLTARNLFLAIRSRDPLVAQRARILVLGTAAGVLPLTVVNFMRNTLGILVIDMRIAYATPSLFLVSLGYITVRHDLLNARVAVQRAVIYAAVVFVLTLVAVLLVAANPYAVAVLLFPLLYVWPRFNARLDAMLYPKRNRYPKIVRSIGAEMQAARDIDQVLAALARTPGRICDARHAVAFLLSGVVDEGEQVRTAGVEGAAPRNLAEEVVVQLLRTTRKEIFRDHIAVEPQYTNIRAECYRAFDRLRAEAVLPVLDDRRVIGGLAVGARTTGDVYGSAELDALSTVAQQAVQAIERVKAAQRLDLREREFSELKRFFPPQVIDQVMARGGAAELRSQRKLVTVLFADLRGFTSFSDRVEPEEVMATLAEYHECMGRRIGEYAGTLERFAGDGLMVFFNDPVEQADHVDRAVAMALAMRGDVERLRGEWRRKGYAIDVGMGIHTGYATCGFVGYEGRRDYSVIGNVTNLAARLSDAAGGGEILISGRVMAELRNGCRAEPVGELALKGFQQPQPVYRLIAPPPSPA